MSTAGTNNSVNECHSAVKLNELYPLNFWWSCKQ